MANGYVCEYDADCEDMRDARAAERGCVIVMPADDELFVDLDDARALHLFDDHLPFLRRFVGVVDVKLGPSPSGLAGKQHAVVKLARPVRSEHERLYFQLLLGSDVRREAFGFLRVHRGEPAPTCFFERRAEPQKQAAIALIPRYVPDGPGYKLTVLTVTSRKYGGQYLPGGKVEPGETPRDALARELEEELGLTRASIEHSQVKSLRFGWSAPGTAEPDRLVHVFGVVLAEGATPSAAEAGTELQWLTIAQLAAQPQSLAKFYTKYAAFLQDLARDTVENMRVF